MDFITSYINFILTSCIKNTSQKIFHLPSQFFSAVIVRPVNYIYKELFLASNPISFSVLGTDNAFTKNYFVS